MAKDPLHFFLNEKVADESAINTFQGDLKQQPFSSNPDPQSLDPGERAMAGILAVSGNVAGSLATWFANDWLMGHATKNIAQQPKFEQFEISSKGGKWPSGKLMGLFDVHSRQPIVPAEAIAEEQRLDRMAMKAEELRARGKVDLASRLESKILPQHPVNKAIWGADHELDKMTKVVDSFIEEKKLLEKGVSIHHKQGPLNFLLGPRYETTTKRVYLPMVNKAVAMHELGHAADYTAGRIGRMRKVLEPMLSHGVKFALPTAFLAGDRIAEVLPGTIDDKAIKFMQDNAPAIMGATLAATSLYPEAKASFLALKHISKIEGPAEARQAFKRLAPAFGTYLLGAIPAVVGMALARKYMREAREEKSQSQDFAMSKLREFEKEGGFNPREMIDSAKEVGTELARLARSSAKDVVYLGKQVGEQTNQIMQSPGTLRRLGQAAKTVGTSPEFVQGALVSSIPAATAALYLYSTESGREIRKRIEPKDLEVVYSGRSSVPLASRKADEEWREQNPARFAGLVAVGAALSGGIMTKLFSDLARVL